jgi:hypothetical protein
MPIKQIPATARSAQPKIGPIVPADRFDEPVREGISVLIEAVPVDSFIGEKRLIPDRYDRIVELILVLGKC